ncbi:hypothetical protein ACE6H2_000832 [Prunus campanulata]
MCLSYEMLKTPSFSPTWLGVYLSSISWWERFEEVRIIFATLKLFASYYVEILYLSSFAPFSSSSHRNCLTYLLFSLTLSEKPILLSSLYNFRTCDWVGRKQERALDLICYLVLLAAVCKLLR